MLVNKFGRNKFVIQRSLTLGASGKTSEQNCTQILTNYLLKFRTMLPT